MGITISFSAFFKKKNVSTLYFVNYILFFYKVACISNYNCMVVCKCLKIYILDWSLNFQTKLNFFFKSEILTEDLFFIKEQYPGRSRSNFKNKADISKLGRHH